MTNYSSQLSQHFLSPWPDVCEVWGLTLKRVGAASLLPWVCAALSLGCFLRLVTFTPLLSTLGTPLPTPRALGGLPPPQGTVPAALIFLGTLDSQLGLLDSRSPLGSSWAPPHSSILQTLSGQTRDTQDPCLVVLSGTMRLEWLMPRVLRAVVSCDLSVGDFVLGGFWWEGKSSLCYPVFAGSKSPLPLIHVLVLLPQSLQLMRV